MAIPALVERPCLPLAHLSLASVILNHIKYVVTKILYWVSMKEVVLGKRSAVLFSVG